MSADQETRQILVTVVRYTDVWEMPRIYRLKMKDSKKAKVANIKTAIQHEASIPKERMAVAAVKGSIRHFYPESVMLSDVWFDSPSVLVFCIADSQDNQPRMSDFRVPAS